MPTQKQVEMIRVVDELHHAARRNYVRLKTEMRGINDTLQADLVEMIPYARQNQGMKYILTTINIFSKKAYGEGEEVKTALESILDSLGHPIKHIHTDRGKEFYNDAVRTMLRRRNIHLYSTFSRMKASICERFNRTIKGRMWKRFTLKSSHKWIDILPRLMSKYNNTKHRTIKMKPNEVDEHNEEQLLRSVYNNSVRTLPKQKFKVGDSVRMSKHKHVFEKGYTPNWTTEIFTIRKVQPTNPTTYLLKDWRDVEIEGVVYAEELLLAKYADIYLVEKVIFQNKSLIVEWAQGNLLLFYTIHTMFFGPKSILTSRNYALSKSAVDVVAELYAIFEHIFLHTFSLFRIICDTVTFECIHFAPQPYKFCHYFTIQLILEIAGLFLVFSWYAICIVFSVIASVISLINIDLHVSVETIRLNVQYKRVGVGVHHFNIVSILWL